MRVIIAGDRNYINYFEFIGHIDVIEAEHDIFIDEVVSGGAKGTDTMGEEWAADNDVICTVFNADWKGKGRAAGPIRNKDMAEYVGKDGGLIAFLAPGSRGTKSMIEIAQKQGLEHIHVININV